MKIGHKNSIVTSTVIFGFIAVMAYAGNLLVAANQLRDLSQQSLQAVSATYLVYGTARGMLVESGDLQRSRERWENALADQQQQMQLLFTHPGQQRLSAAASQRLAAAQTTYRYVDNAFEDFRGRLVQLQETDIPGLVTKPGLLRIQMHLRESQQSFGQIPNLVASAESRIESAVGLNNQLAQHTLLPLSERIIAEANVYVSRSLRTVLLAAIGMTVISFAFAFVFSSRLSRKMQELHGVMEEMANKDFRRRSQVHSRDELGAIAGYINTIQERVGAFFGQVRSSAASVGELKDSVSAAASESAAALNQITRNVESLNQQFQRLDGAVTEAGDSISGITGGVTHLSESIQRQSAAIEQSLASFEQINASVQSVAQVAEDRRSGAEQLLQVVQTGGGYIETTNETISQIARQVDAVLEIVSVINDVSNQTNLLSMNAAIESAHAGEAGKGFAVVAEEIRKLSESTREHAAGITQIVNSVAEQIQSADHASTEGYQAFENIQQEVSRFTESMAEINNGMRELSVGSREVLAATQEVSQITQDIRQDSTDISRQNQQIEEAMEHARQISTTAVSGMQEMEIGIKEILEALQDMTEKTSESRERMEQLLTVVQEFAL
ncbi:methyl-accepting chemotaxis protein [Spirochaeta africana]|uniref:Methyl-accepting chemotaxis protein n=1 Tax=Spirochaeta africana (strain ATCC 700263 / DSM 8902 / Z-7692) TaxID=889378 RepID=H9ULS1_SPIAZ|nr:HAMP domain-containing methyl-accepting chemotaxis protein [Spirochaeta africana]AFG38464.1 methyl-accepting chemotaxis protein [Spirochaeta africana DSM 8902]